jgi:hypothetical protein
MKQYNSYEEYKKDQIEWHVKFIDKAKKALETESIKNKNGEELTLEKAIEEGYDQYLLLRNYMDPLLSS